MLVETAKGFIRHDSMSLAAAVAFYTSFSFAPLVLLVIAVGGLLGHASEQSLLSAMDEQLGPRAAEVALAVKESSERDGEQTGTLRWIASLALLLVSSSAIFGQLQASLNIIWEVKASPRSGILAWIRKRLLSLGMVLAALFILLVSLVLTALIEQILPRGASTLARVSEFGASFVVSTLLFGAIYRVLPDTHISWKAVCRGALLTGALFSVGKFILAMYLDRSDVADSYGSAAGSIVALLVWVYYSCIILFVGAEFTRVTSDKSDFEQAAEAAAHPHVLSVRSSSASAIPPAPAEPHQGTAPRISRAPQETP